MARAERQGLTGEGWAARADRRGLSGKGWAARAERQGLTGKGWAARADRRGLSGKGWPARADRQRLTGKGWAARADRQGLTGEGWAARAERQGLSGMTRFNPRNLDADGHGVSRMPAIDSWSLDVAIWLTEKATSTAPCTSTSRVASGFTFHCFRAGFSLSLLGWGL